MDLVHFIPHLVDDYKPLLREPDRSANKMTDYSWTTEVLIPAGKVTVKLSLGLTKHHAMKTY